MFVAKLRLTEDKLLKAVTLVENVQQLGEDLCVAAEIVLREVERDQAATAADAIQDVEQRLAGQRVVSEVKMGQQAVRRGKQRIERFGAFLANFEFILIAVVVGEVE